MKEMAEDSRGQDRGLDALDASEESDSAAHSIHYFFLSFLNNRPNLHRAKYSRQVIRVYK